jgi:hypothetical protein
MQIVRITRKSGHRADIGGRLKCARRGLMHRSKWTALFDDFIGRSRESHRYVDAI